MGQPQICAAHIRSVASAENARLEIFLYSYNSFMFEIEYLHNFSLVNSSNGARRRTLLGPEEAKQRHATEIYPHYNNVFPVHYCSLSRDV